MAAAARRLCSFRRSVGQPAALVRRSVGQPAALVRRFQLRRLCNAASPDAPEPDEKSMKQELAASKKLSASLYKLEERIKLLSTSFWVSVAFVMSSSLTVSYYLSSLSSELKGLTQEKKNLDTDVKNLQQRVFALEYASSYAEKHGKLAPLPKILATPPPKADAA